MQAEAEGEGKNTDAASNGRRGGDSGSSIRVTRVRSRRGNEAATTATAEQAGEAKDPPQSSADVVPGSKLLPEAMAVTALENRDEDDYGVKDMQDVVSRAKRSRTRRPLQVEEAETSDNVDDGNEKKDDSIYQRRQHKRKINDKRV
eukprot:TRINITY_DN9876_c0_g1_i2.p2 TRINITY_DN9876_c0_g1~~TRINITY_DN9876_c0_g1_i2.p2  ORF type:complete len:146 (-),score=41.62 TRINITY_DN9876_c0_g1_i2:44-481(-)